MIKTSNKKARQYVESRIPFRGSNTFGEGNDYFYVVYSYGYHYPMFVWDGEVWLENSEDFSRSTSKHHGQLRPSNIATRLSTAELNKITDAVAKANISKQFKS